MSPAAKKTDDTTKVDAPDTTKAPDDTSVGTLGGKDAAAIEAELSADQVENRAPYKTMVEMRAAVAAIEADLLDQQGVLAASTRKTNDGRAKCEIDQHDGREIECLRPEVTDNAGLCAAHWSGRPDLRKVAYRGK